MKLLLLVCWVVRWCAEGYKATPRTASTSTQREKCDRCYLISSQTVFFTPNLRNSRIFSVPQSSSKANSQKTNSTSGVLSSLKTDSALNADRTRGSLARIIEDSWSRVSQLIPESTLILCQEELRGATSLLVLATVRRAADDSAVSRATVEGMFREADANNDGQLTFQEWFTWLGAAPTSSYQLTAKSEPSLLDGMSGENNKSSTGPETTGWLATVEVDPMVEALSLVLSNAVCTLKTTARITQDPSVLAAAFVAGGAMAGVLDASVCETMLSRLSQRTREMVTKSLLLESDSLPSSFRAILTPISSTKPDKKMPSSGAGYRGVTSTTRTAAPPATETTRFIKNVRNKENFNADIDEGGDVAAEESEEKMRETKEKRIKLRAERSVILSKTDNQNGPESVVGEGRGGGGGGKVQGSVQGSAQGQGQGQGQGHTHASSAKAGRTGGSVGGQLLRMSSELLSSLKGLKGRETAPAPPPPLKMEINAEVTRDRDQDIIQTVDLPSVFVLVAPPIEDRVDSVSPVTFVPAADVYSTPSSVPPSSINGHARSSKKIKSYTVEEFRYNEFDLDEFSDQNGGINVPAGQDLKSSNSDAVSDIDGLGLVMEGSIEEVEYSDIRYAGNSRQSQKNEEEERAKKSNIKKSTDRVRSGLKYFLPTDGLSQQSSRAGPGVGVGVEGMIGSWGSDMRASGLQFTPNSDSDPSIRSSTPMSVALMSATEEMANELTALKNDLGDLDDPHALIMRQLLLRKGEGRTDVLGLAMALRSTRLQHSARFPVSVKQQLAVETLQLWAPLSYQVGLSAQIPELEIYSYVLLFPSSFGTFVNWYGEFRPVAKGLLASFRTALTKRLKRDSVMPLLSDGVTIQSRLKTPPSAFKKMFKSSKRRQQLHDMIGMRIIISEKGEVSTNPLTGSHSSDSSSSSGGSSGSSSSSAGGNKSTGSGNDDEEAAVWRVYSIVCSALSSSASAGGSAEWVEDKSRFKDYVTAPKPSGYRSIHMTLLHKVSGVKMEVQIRSQRMHNEAEYGAAAHTKYKALILPSGIPGKDGKSRHTKEEKEKKNELDGCSGCRLNLD